MDTPAFGTRAWGRNNGGRLTPIEHMKATADAVRALLEARILDRFRSAKSLGVVDLAPPGSALSTRVAELLAETSPPWLEQHGYRTFAWALGFAARDGIGFDRELLWCAALLHDLGITPQFLPPQGGCFALSGADAGEDALRVAGMPKERAAIVAEAIALHLNLVVALADHGPEAHLLRAATAFDVTGQQFRTVDPVFRRRVLALHPRTSFVESIAETIGEQGVRSPATRIGFACRHLGLVTLARRSPWRD